MAATPSPTLISSALPPPSSLVASANSFRDVRFVTPHDDYPIFSMVADEEDDAASFKEAATAGVSTQTGMETETETETDEKQLHRKAMLMDGRTPSLLQQSRRLLSSTTSMEHCQTHPKSTVSGYLDTPMNVQMHLHPISSAGTPSLSEPRNAITPAVVSLSDLQEMIGLPKKDLKTHSHGGSLLRSWFSSFTKRTTTTSNGNCKAEGKPSSISPNIVDDWNLTLDGLKQKLLHTSIKRDVALTEVRQLKSSMRGLEEKLRRVEMYCDNLKNALSKALKEHQMQNQNQTHNHNQHQFFPANFSNMNPITFEEMVDTFLESIAEARSAVRHLCRMFVVVLQEDDSGKGVERLNALLQSFHLDTILSNKISRAALYHLEALFNHTLYQDFENCNFEKNGCQSILDPYESCTANFSSFNSMRSLGWEQVVSKGTKFFSESFSRFCDAKMSQIVSMLQLSTAWPEQLLKAFFVASKSVWLLHLLAFSFHPPLSIFRVDSSANFDAVYMEDMLEQRVNKALVLPATVRIMVMPGFYIHNNVIKCKVLCRYRKQ